MRVHAALAPKPADLRLALGQNVLTGRAGFQQAFGPPTTLEEDVLNVLSAIYASDLAIKRLPRERVLRSIDLTVSVINHRALDAIRSDLEYVLYVLSHDNWTLHFEQQRGTQEAHRDWPQAEGMTLLFSGGLDSFCAAGEMVSRARPVHLVSHVTHNRVVSSAQTGLHAHLEQHCGRAIPRFVARVSGRTRTAFSFPTDTDREDTQRTRSLLFLGLACLAARRTGFGQILTIAENGQMALHLPLTTARIGPFSTHTAHPEFVQLAEQIFTRLLGYVFTFVNPYLYMTKAEVVQRLPDPLQPYIPETVSCWRASRVSQSHSHCGECVPCLVRRFALEASGIRLPEYHRDLFAEDIGNLAATDIGKGNIVDLLELVRQFSPAQMADRTSLAEKFTDLVNNHIDLAQAVALYQRFSAEAQHVITGYPSLRALIP